MAVITEEELERRRRLIETDAMSRRGLSVDQWRTDEDGDIQAVFGRWFITEEGEQSDGLFAGDEGVLTASVVGAPEHHNERVAFFFEGAEEVVPFTDVEPL